MVKEPKAAFPVAGRLSDYTATTAEEPLRECGSLYWPHLGQRTYLKPDKNEQKYFTTSAF